MLGLFKKSIPTPEPKPQNRTLWGLFQKDSKNPVPLKSLDISIKIVHNIARIFYSQVYYNETDSLLETQFFFPISPEVCFDSFEASFKDTIIKGVVKQKEKAKEEYKEAIQKGKTAAYSEVNEETGDVMKVLIGNIPPDTNISITYSYIQKLDRSLNKFWCFRLFGPLTSRYNSNLKDLLKEDIKVLSSYPTLSKNSSEAYPWKIQAEIQSPSPISFLSSPSHEIVTTYGNENHTCNVTLNPAIKSFPSRDFVLLYSNGKEDQVDYLLTPFEDGYCAMVSLTADFDKVSGQETYDNFVKAKEVESSHAMDTVRGEYIFLIDRSGSMHGERINMARTSLILFLKSLPSDSFFNVVSFGSDDNFLHNSSIAYSQESIDSSVQRIQGFGADMGGTEIYEPLRKIFASPLKTGYPRFVFLLTDGAVSNTRQVLDLIMVNNDKARVFTIGIGNGCSPELITKGASYGRGKEEFVTSNEQIFEKVINLLKVSLSPCFSDLSLHGDNFDALVKSVSPNPVSLPFLINGETVTFFLFLRECAFQDTQEIKLQLRLYDSRVQKYHIVEFVLNKDEALENDMIPKLGIYDIIKRLETQKDQVSANSNKDIVWMDAKELKQAMAEYSVKYGILCKETAFFCEVSNVVESSNLPQAKIVIPTIETEDYKMPDTNVPNTKTSTLGATGMWKLFGAKKPSPAPSHQNNVDPERQKKIVQMEKTLEDIRDKIDIGYKKIDAKEQKIKDLIRQNQKNEAKKQLQNLKSMQEEVAKQENYCVVLEKTKIQVEVSQDASGAVEAFKDATALQKESEKNREFLEDFLIDKQERSEQNKEIGQLLSDISAGIDQENEELDDLYKELEQEVLDAKIESINQASYGNAVKPQVKSAIQSNTGEPDQLQASTIDDLLAEAACYCEEPVQRNLASQKEPSAAYTQQQYSSSLPVDTSVSNLQKSMPAYQTQSITSVPSSNISSSPSYIPQSTTKRAASYLDIIMKQKIEGYWDPNDQDLIQSILKDKNLGQIPEKINVSDVSQAKKIWITILVLLWLEVVCKADQKAWTLIHQKGCEWLKKYGIAYEEVKEVGASLIKPLGS